MADVEEVGPSAWGAPWNRWRATRR